MTDIDRLPGIKERELVKLGNCAICKRRLLDSPGVTFYRVRIERAGLMRAPLERRVGLEMMLGSGPLAAAMGPDEDLAKILDGPHEVIVHENCARDIGHLLSLVPVPKEEGDAA